MIFTPDHCRTLATSGRKTNIGFRWCEFQDLEDRGAALHLDVVVLLSKHSTLKLGIISEAHTVHIYSIDQP
jgi:hypothetical protein